MCDAGDRGCEDGVDTVVLKEVKYAKKNLIVEMEMDPEYEQAIDDLINEERLNLAHLKYDEQLKLKSDRSLELFNALKDQMSAANIENAQNLKASQIMQPIRYGNVTRSCYNTYNFAIGYDVDGNVNVGLITKHSSTTTDSFVNSVDSYSHISTHVKRIVRAFKKFIVESGQQPFNEFNHTGVWRSLTILECIGDVSMVAGIVAMENSECEENLKKSFSDRFLRDDNFTDADSQFQVLSVYWKRTTIEDCKRTITLEHIGG
ncbi:unnamed protein product [Anisakis simplex]|uniref:DUF4371 domain-containing protein n=1 Tax=Anisakis simplex TaxID=6269 RepID=A0A0M3J3W0_ANISI|nr:unnamed protein product [Anisakis simplex]